MTSYYWLSLRLYCLRQGMKTAEGRVLLEQRARNEPSESRIPKRNRTDTFSKGGKRVRFGGLHTEPLFCKGLVEVVAGGGIEPPIQFHWPEYEKTL